MPQKPSRDQRAYLCRYREILSRMIKDMTQVELNCSISHNFIVQMIPHHRAAIEMSESLLEYQPCPPLVEIARSIIREQTESIRDMEAILEPCGACTDGQVQLYQRRVRQVMAVMFSRMKSAPATGSIDQDFIRRMLPHHEGAIAMSHLALCYPICGELKPILETIITSQERGVREMKALLC